MATAASAGRMRKALETLRRLPPRPRASASRATGHRGTSTESTCGKSDRAPGETSGRRGPSRRSTCSCPALREKSTWSISEMADGEPPWAPETLRWAPETPQGTAAETGCPSKGHRESVEEAAFAVNSHRCFFPPFLPPLPPPFLPSLPPPPFRRCSLAHLLLSLTAAQPPPR